MKISLPLFTSLLLTTAASAASLPDLDPHFAYRFLQPGQIDFCPGVVPRVLSAGPVVNSVDGQNETWTQADFDKNRNNPHVPFHDMRADFESQVRSFDFRNHAYDDSLRDWVPLGAGLMEQIGARHAQVSVCVSKMDLVNVSQDLGTLSTLVRFDVGFKYFLTLDADKPTDGRRTLLVEQLEGQKAVPYGLFELYVDNEPRAFMIMPNTWNRLQWKISGGLEPVPSRETQGDQVVVEEWLNDYLKQH